MKELPYKPYVPNIPPLPLTRGQMRACALMDVPFQLRQVWEGKTIWRTAPWARFDGDDSRYRLLPGYTLTGETAERIWGYCDQYGAPRVQFQYWHRGYWLDTNNRYFTPRKNDRYIYRVSVPGMNGRYTWDYAPTPVPVYTPPVDHFSTPEFNEAVARVAKAVHHAANELTERQLIEAFTQALKAGEFQRHIWVSGNGQRVVYIPFAEKERLEGEIAALREQLNGTDRKG